MASFLNNLGCQRNIGRDDQIPGFHTLDDLIISNIKARLNMRDFMDTLRSSGINTGGPPAISLSDRQEFANNLDRFLAKYANNG